MDKNEAQIRVLQSQKKPQALKKIFFEKFFLPAYLCRYDFFFKQMDLEIFKFGWFYGSQKLLFAIKLSMKLDRQKIKKIPHTVFDTIISQIMS